MYYAQHACFAATGRFAPTYAELLRHYSTPPFELCPAFSNPDGVSIEVAGEGPSSGFVATVPSPDGGPWAATVTNGRFLTVATVAGT